MRPWALSRAEDILGRTIQAIILKVSYQSCSRGHYSHSLRAGGHGRNCSRQAREPSVKRGKKHAFLWERHTSGRWRVDVSKVVPQPEPKNKKSLMQTGDRAALCPWASSLWGGQSAVIFSRGKGRWWVVIILPTANWLVRALGLPSVCESPSSRTPGRAKVSSQRPSSSPASTRRTNRPQEGRWQLHSGWRSSQAGPPLSALPSAS